MNPLFSRCLPLALAALSLASFSASAQVSVTISGEIQEVVCTPTLTGTNVTANSIGLETITFALSNCGMSSATSHMWVYFNAASITGGRINTNHPQVAFQIMDVTSGGALGNQVNVGDASGTAPTPQQGTAAAFTGPMGSRSATKDYIVRYYAKEAVNQAASVAATASYTVKYY